MQASWPRLRVIVLAAALTGPAAAAADPGQDLAPGQKRAIEDVIRQYLLDHPEVIVEAMEKLQERRRAAEAEAARKALAANGEAIFNDPSSPVADNGRGDVSLVEFFDYRCGVCKRVHPIVAKLMAGDGGLRRIYKEWPILGPASVYAARAALASRYQGKYFSFHNALMEAQGGLNEQSILKIAKRIGIDVARLVKDMERPEIEATLRRNFALAEKLNLTGTPSFVVGDRLVRGGRDLQTMQGLVAEQRAKNKKK